MKKSSYSPRSDFAGPPLPTSLDGLVHMAGLSGPSAVARVAQVGAVEQLAARKLQFAVQSSVSHAALAGDLSPPALERAQSGYERFGFKRGVDIVIASLALLFILPVLPFVVLALLIQDGTPVIYRQSRVGLGGRTFMCLKFRSMARDAKDRLEQLLSSCEHSRGEWERTQKLRSDPRIHRVGELLRKSSLDEIPQLINVIRGEMSIVGPRPMMLDQAALYGDSLPNYTSMRPGITGLWQVSGRNTLSFRERVALDNRYAARVTFMGDLRILFRTVWVVLIGHGSC